MKREGSEVEQRAETYFDERAYNFHGIDVAPGMVGQARQRPRAFDLVLAIRSIEYLDDPRPSALVERNVRGVVRRVRGLVGGRRTTPTLEVEKS